MLIHFYDFYCSGSTQVNFRRCGVAASTQLYGIRMVEKPNKPSGGGQPTFAMALIAKKLHRLIKVREGGKTVELPAIQAVMRNLIAEATKGNAAAMNAVLKAVQVTDALAIQAAADEAAAPKREMSDNEVARRIALILSGKARIHENVRAIPDSSPEVLPETLKDDPSQSCRGDQGDAQSRNPTGPVQQGTCDRDRLIRGDNLPHA
jgi:uncharacterized protein DUF5681